MLGRDTVHPGGGSLGSWSHSVCRLAVKRDECARSVDFHLSLSLRPQPTDTVRVGLPTQMLPCILARKALVEICLPGDSTAYQLVDQY